MDMEKLLFFDKHREALPLYEKFEERVLAEIESVTVKVQKTQISFYNRRMFACISFARVRSKALCPDSYIVVTLGLDHRLDSPRIDVATEPYPNRWTHHILIADCSEIDDELMTWVRTASLFAANKR